MPDRQPYPTLKKFDCQNCFRVLFFHAIQEGYIDILCKRCDHFNKMVCKKGFCRVKKIVKKDEPVDKVVK